LGFFKNKYPELFHLSHIIKSGDEVMDIGANLGYYSVRMARIVGSNGRVHMIEPVPMFQEILKKNTRKYAAFTILYPYALGTKDEEIDFDTPLFHGSVNHGRTGATTVTNPHSFKVPMRNADSLFAAIDKLVFIKIDVEGYENHVVPAMKQLILRCKPILQIEVDDKNKLFIYNFFRNINYRLFYLDKNVLKPLSKENYILFKHSDFYFYPQPS